MEEREGVSGFNAEARRCQNDVAVIYTLGCRKKTALQVLDNLCKLPIVSVRKIEEWTGLSRPQANELVKKLVDIGILEQKDKDVEYGREFWYRKYLGLFLSREEEKVAGER